MALTKLPGPNVKFGTASLPNKASAGVLIEPVWYQRLQEMATAVNAAAGGAAAASSFVANVKTDYGARGDDFADDTANIVAALAAHNTIFFPDGVYRISGPITVGPNKTLFGFNSATTIIKTTSATADILNITNIFATVCGLGFASSVPRTAGSFVNLGASSHRFRMWDFHMTAPWTGINIAGPADVRIFNGRIFSTVVGADSISVDGTLALCMGQLLFDGDPTLRWNSCLRIHASGDITLTDCQFLTAEHGCLIDPGAGKEVDSIWMVQCSFDNNGTHGLKIAPTGTGVVNRCNFVRSWAASAHAGNGIYLAAAGGALINGMIFDTAEVYGNFVAGIVLDGVGISNVQISDSKISGNPIGLYINDATKVDINDTRLGASGGFGANAQDIVLLGACDEISFTGNRLDGTVNWTTTGLDINWVGNAGFSGWKAYTPAVTSATGAFTTVAATGSYLKMGKTVEVRIAITVTTNGTAATSVIATLPFTAETTVEPHIWAGRETVASGVMLQGVIDPAATAVSIFQYDNTFRGASGDTLVVSGAYETA